MTTPEQSIRRESILLRVLWMLLFLLVWQVAVPLLAVSRRTVAVPLILWCAQCIVYEFWRQSESVFSANWSLCRI